MAMQLRVGRYRAKARARLSSVDYACVAMHLHLGVHNRASKQLRVGRSRGKKLVPREGEGASVERLGEARVE
eukprot:2798658-Rhodomonas_salina.1